MFFLSYFQSIIPEDPQENQNNMDPDSINPFSNRLDLEPNASKLYESRWLNVHIPQNTKSVMLQPLKNMIIPAWFQGTHLGLRYNQDAVEYQLQQQGMIAASFHGHTSNIRVYAVNYPRNPTGVSSVAGLCTRDGRHLALLFDPSLVYHPWQWQYIPQSYKKLTTSPWALMFTNMYLWCLKEKPS